MNFETIIKEHHLKVTPQRLAILTNMHSYGHIDIDSLYTEVKKQFSSISLATMYKNINLMIKNSLVKEVKLPLLKSRYEIRKKTHAHLLCTKCNEFEDIPFPCTSLVGDIEKETSYKIDDSEFIFSGLCQKCQ